MTTQKQINANQRNAKKSTGPNTIAGKQRVSTNAIKHGLQANTCRMAWESEDDFNNYRSAMIVELSPVGAIEFVIADSIITAQWRLKRLCDIENGALYRSIANAIEIRSFIANTTGNTDNIPISDKCSLTITDLNNKHESILAAGFAYDLSEGQTLVHINRFRRSYERTISENLDRLEAMQQARFKREHEAEIEVYEDDMITDNGNEENDKG